MGKIGIYPYFKGYKLGTKKVKREWFFLFERGRLGDVFWKVSLRSSGWVWSYSLSKYSRGPKNEKF